MSAFYEERVFPLTTNTNCYTAYTPNGRWATERHIVHWDHKQQDELQWTELPVGRLGVGYTSVSPWEAIALLPDDWQPSIQHDDEVRHSVATMEALSERTTSDDAGIIPSRSHSLVVPVHTSTMPTDDADFSNNHSMPELTMENNSVELLHSSNTAEILVRRIDPPNDEDYTIPIPYRPVALHMIQSEDSPRIFTGSADHHKLHAYERRNTEFQLVHETEFPASVLAMTSCQETLIVACQDGSIVTLELGDTGTLTQRSTVIIDGPILALSCRQNVVTIGSLCGYVAQKKDGVLCMVVEGLTTHANQEDAVLAVDSTADDHIWVGTRSGRCLAYRRDDDDNGTWGLVWSVQLPYAIHGVFYDNTMDRMVVTTTRGVHIFRSLANAMVQARQYLAKLQQQTE